jgi:hypothetical protein
MTKGYFDNNSYLSDEQVAELDLQVKSLKESKSKMYPWEEVKTRILKEHAKRLNERKK